MKKIPLALVVVVIASLACNKEPASRTAEPVALPSAPLASASASASTAALPSAAALDVDDSGLTLRGPIPNTDGHVAMQSDEKYAALRYGHAALGPNGLVVHLTEHPLKCGEWPRYYEQLGITFQLSPGPSGDFFAGKVVTTHIEYSHRGFGHIKLDPVDLVEGKHITGQIAFSDPGSGHHNGAVVKPSRGAGSFDVAICPVDAADRARLDPPRTLTAAAPLAYELAHTTGTPKTILAMVEWDGADAQPWVSRVQVFEQAGVTCESPFVKSGVDMKIYFGLVAADLATPEPARFEPDGFGAHTSRDSKIAWIRFDRFDLKTATTAKGTILAFAQPYDTDPGATTPEHLPPVSLAGTFEAKICRYGSRFGKPYL